VRRTAKLVLFAVLIYTAFGLAVFLGMLLPPDRFARLATGAPTSVMFAALPVEIMWKTARAGRLRPGDPAPDFSLTSTDKTSVARLSSHRGVRPVMLIFGSYT
jgi:hypothetical protein